MKKETSFSPKRIEEAAKAHDILSRARAAGSVDQGRDLLRRPVDGMDERFGFAADSAHLRL